jgi:predicted Fe-Mo cluster-binding NifX family protein
MKIAIPLAEGRLTMHFGHCERFALLDVDPVEKKILGRQDIEPPAHQPGVFPPWLAAQGVTLVLAGGMGPRAIELFHRHGVEVIIGAPVEFPEKLAADYLAGTLQTGENVCDH